MHDQNNVFLAIALSVIVLITWQYFFATSFSHKETGRKAPQIDRLAPNAGMSPQVQISPQVQVKQPEAFPSSQQHQKLSRQQALDRSPRVAIDTPSLQGSISLRGGR